jgi:hypothetical protein
MFLVAAAEPSRLSEMMGLRSRNKEAVYRPDLPAPTRAASLSSARPTSMGALWLRRDRRGQSVRGASWSADTSDLI